MRIKLNGKSVVVLSEGVQSLGGTNPKREEIEIAKEYLRKCKRTKAACVGSYILKGCAERHGGTFRYVSNGALIVGAAELGIRMVDSGHGLNVKVCVQPIRETFEQMHRTLTKRV